MAEVAPPLTTQEIYDQEKIVRAKTFEQMQMGDFVTLTTQREIEFSSLSMQLVSIPWSKVAHKTMLEFIKAFSNPREPSGQTMKTLLRTRTFSQEYLLLLNMTLDRISDNVTLRVLHEKILSFKKHLPVEVYLPLIGYSLEDEDFLEEAPPIDFSPGDLVSVQKEDLPNPLTGIILEMKSGHAIVRINTNNFFMSKRESLRWLKPSYKRVEKQACINRYQTSLDKCALKCHKPPPQISGTAAAEPNFPVVLLSGDEDAVVFSLNNTDFAFTDVSRIERVRAILQAHNEDVEVYSMKMLAQFKHTK